MSAGESDGRTAFTELSFGAAQLGDRGRGLIAPVYLVVTIAAPCRAAILEAGGGPEVASRASVVAAIAPLGLMNVTPAR